MEEFREDFLSRVSSAGDVPESDDADHDEESTTDGVVASLLSPAHRR